MHVGQEGSPSEPWSTPGAFPPPPPPPAPAASQPDWGWPSAPPTVATPAPWTPRSPYDAPPAALGPAPRWTPLVYLAVVIVVIAGVGAVLLAATRTTSHPAAVPPPTFDHPAAQSPSTHGRPPTTRDRTSAGTVVDQAMAAQVLHQYWPVHERALVSRDLATLARLTAGPEQDWQQPAVACGCLNPISPDPLIRATYYVPRQHSYPAWFLADAATTERGQAFDSLLVFTKARPGAPWLASFEGWYPPIPGVGPHGPVTDGAGYDAPPPAALHQRATHVAARLAALWQQAKDTGGYPSDSGFLLTGQTGERVNYLASYRQDQVQANGLIGHFRFFVSPRDRLFDVSDSGGRDLACQPVREVVHYTPTPGHYILQDAQRQAWGPGLAPGDYSEITRTDTWQTCFVLSADPNVPVEVMNHDIGGAWASSGTPIGSQT